MTFFFENKKSKQINYEKNTHRQSQNTNLRIRKFKTQQIFFLKHAINVNEELPKAEHFQIDL